MSQYPLHVEASLDKGVCFFFPESLSARLGEWPRSIYSISLAALFSSI